MVISMSHRPWETLDDPGMELLKWREAKTAFTILHRVRVPFDSKHRNWRTFKFSLSYHTERGMASGSLQRYWIHHQLPPWSLVHKA
jgi:hypothetical protein